MAAAPAIVKFVGGSASDAIKNTKEMYQITMTSNPDFTIPNLDFAGAPLGIDIRKVVDSGITPIINTGIAHKNPGVGQVGAGIVRAPFPCFQNALTRFHTKHLSHINNSFFATNKKFSTTTSFKPSRGLWNIKPSRGLWNSLSVFQNKVRTFLRRKF